MFNEKEFIHMWFRGLLAMKEIAVSQSYIIVGYYEAMYKAAM